MENNKPIHILSKAKTATEDTCQIFNGNLFYNFGTTTEKNL